MIWRKASYSNASGGNCIEVACTAADAIAVRDSKDPKGTRLLFTSDEWQAFTSRVKDERSLA